MPKTRVIRHMARLRNFFKLAMKIKTSVRTFKLFIELDFTVYLNFPQILYGISE